MGITWSAPLQRFLVMKNQTKGDKTSERLNLQNPFRLFRLVSMGSVFRLFRDRPWPEHGRSHVGGGHQIAKGSKSLAAPQHAATGSWFIAVEGWGKAIVKKISLIEI